MMNITCCKVTIDKPNCKVMQTWEKASFVNSEILGIQIWQKKRVNYNKFEIATKQLKSNI